VLTKVIIERVFGSLCVIIHIGDNTNMGEKSVIRRVSPKRKNSHAYAGASYAPAGGLKANSYLMLHLIFEICEALPVCIPAKFVICTFEIKHPIVLKIDPTIYLERKYRFTNNFFVHKSIFTILNNCKTPGIFIGWSYPVIKSR